MADDFSQGAYHADSSWRGKLRRRTVRLASRRPARSPRRPMLSFAFDDVPASAVVTGAEILERRGLRVVQPIPRAEQSLSALARLQCRVR